MHYITTTLSTVASDMGLPTAFWFVIGVLFALGLLASMADRNERREGSQNLAVEVESHAAHQARQNA